MSTTYINNYRDDEPVQLIQSNIGLMVSAAREFMLICLWPCSSFPAADATTEKKQIRRILVAGIDPYKNYLEFCQRVVLTKQAMAKNTAAVLPGIPARWLDPGRAAGFDASLPAFLFLQETRKKFPLHRLALKALAEAILEMAEEPSQQLFNYWVNWFKERHAAIELFLFTIFAAFNNYKTGGHE